MAKKAAALQRDRDLWPTVEALRASGEAMSVHEMLDRLTQGAGAAARARIARQPAGAARHLARHGGAQGRAPRLGRTAAGRLQVMPPAAFERLCQRMLLGKGFERVEVTGKSGDGGIDGLGVLRLNLLSFPVLFQCKRYRGQVGSAVVRDFRGALVGRAEKGLIITTGSFSREARREAMRAGAPPIDLIDGPALCQILKELRLGVGVTLVENVTILEADLADL